MPSTNGHGPKRAVLYARVSTDEQARSGYSLAQQIEALTNYATREGFEVLEVVRDAGQSGASLERPGMDRIRDLVTAGGVSVVLAQDRDRFAREPAYHYLLRREFEEFGCKMRSLNDRGDDSPEGELTDGILDQLAKFERAKTAERTRRGKLQKAREGKVLAGHTPPFGFRYNDARDNYVVDEENMRVIARIFRMVGAEGHTMCATRLAFNREGVRPPSGGRYWSPKYIREAIKDDVYRPHSFEEVAPLVSPDVAARLDPKKRYGIWWFNRRRYASRQVAVNGPGGRSYRRQIKVTDKPRSEWVAVPVPESGIPREWVDAARDAIQDNKRPSTNGERYWELSGGVTLCAECGCRMVAHTCHEKKTGKTYHYYKCPKRKRHGLHDACANKKHNRAERTEAAVWELVSGLLKDPERLRIGLEAMIERERAGMRGDPDREAASWLQALSEADRERRGYLRLAAKGQMSDEELEEALAELEDTRATAERELAAVRGRKEALEALERDRDALLESYAEMAPEALDALTGEERRRVYAMLRLKVDVAADGGMEVRGILSENVRVLYENGRPAGGECLCENGLASACTTCRRCMGSGRPRLALRWLPSSSARGLAGFATPDGP
jgi:site-specific DNA recombinase